MKPSRPLSAAAIYYKMMLRNGGRKSIQLEQTGPNKHVRDKV